MPFDIYGQALQRGHYEVHPYAWGEYPCAIYIQEQQQAEQQRDYDIAMREQQTIESY